MCDTCTTDNTNSNEYTVKGMTCGHCVSSVTEEVSQIDGIGEVEIDLSTGSLTFASDKPVDPASVRAAVEEAGYELVTG